MAHTDYVAQTGDARFTDLGLTFTDDQRRNPDQTAVIADIRAAVAAAAGQAIAADLTITQSAQIRAASLTIFDRSFAITRWLQLVAIGIGLFGVASSFSAQVLSRQREFGMLMHLGYTRGQLSAMVTAEGFIWSLIGGLVGAALGLVVSAVLVFVVNPQSFHWTMDWQIPWGDVALMVLAVMASGTGTCWLIARQTLRQSMVQSVKQDW
jgi:putative ABC transport system permease protein